jgi:ATP-dependent Lon protease
MSYLRSNAERLGLAPHFTEKLDFHVHVPGPYGKDGPSAGVGMLTALVSLMTGIKVRSDTAMTGEVSLRGVVMPVGGIKEKVLAAHRAGIKRIIMPEKNKKDLHDVPEQAKKEIEFHFVSRMDNVLDLALESTPWKTAPAQPAEEPKPEVRA